MNNRHRAKTTSKPKAGFFAALLRLQPLRATPATASGPGVGASTASPKLRTRLVFASLSLLAALAALLGAGASTAAAAEPCPNEALRRGPSANLPDCRAYEQVSPVQKDLNDAIGRPGLTQSSPSGERVTFGSLGPFPGVPGSSEYPTYLAARAASGSGWSTQGLLPQTEGSPPDGAPPPDAGVWALTEDLSHALLNVGISSSLYDTAQERSAPFAPVASLRFAFAGAAADDSAILFEDALALPGTTGAQEGAPNLYEWAQGQSQLIAADAVAGPGGEFAEGERSHEYYTQHTISADGSRVFYTSLAPGPTERRVYMREGSGEPVPISTGPAEWRAATPDGSTALYTEAGGLYRWCERLPQGPPCEGEGEAGEPVITEIAPPTAGVQGTLGISDDGSYVYFVAEGQRSLYEWHRGLTTHITDLNTNVNEESDWRGYENSEPLSAEAGQKSSRVTPSGNAVLFASDAPLTGYPNVGHIEIYRYDASTAGLTCVSCNPSAQPATSGAYLSRGPIPPYFALPPIRANGYLTRNFSADGNRAFFETAEPLISTDRNTGANPGCEPGGSGCDVYEWEADGAGSCRSEAQNGGCLYLISSGRGDSVSYFGDASADGRDVFFFTGQPLVAQDGDGNFDLYDARAAGGIFAQNERPPPPCESGEACREGGAAQPPLSAPATSRFEGPQEGSLHPEKPRSRCQKGFVRRHGKCVKHKHTGPRRDAKPTAAPNQGARR